MKRKLINALWVALAALLLTTSIQADYDINEDNCEFTCQPCDFGFNIGADFVYFKATQNHNEYARVRSSTDPFFFDTKYHSVCHDFAPGLRVRLGKSDVMCCWDFDMQYTHFTHSQKDQVSGLVRDSGQGAYLSGTFNFGSGKQDVNYNNLEILFGRNIDCGTSHHFKPFFGLDILWFDQDFTSYLTLPEAAPLIFQYERSKWSTDLSAYGLKAGSHYNLSLPCNFELYGIFSGSVLYADADLYSQAVFATNDQGLISNGFKINFREHRLGTIFSWQVGAGVSYKRCFCNRQFKINLGYQFIQWCNIPGGNDDRQLIRGVNSTFGLQGLVLGVDTSF